LLASAPFLSFGRSYMCGFRLEGSFRMIRFFMAQPPIILAQVV
jgi:hypothetical protein